MMFHSTTVFLDYNRRFFVFFLGLRRSARSMREICGPLGPLYSPLDGE